jgi:sugar phosphate isomerase/epimerase
MDRRNFLMAAGSAIVLANPARQARTGNNSAPEIHVPKARFRTGLVAYSYRQALQSKAMTYEDLFRVAVDTGVDGIDMTVYWLPGTSDDILLPLRRAAYKNRVEIYSIGTRVRLAQPTPELREKELVELRKWVDVAQKLGATHVRVFGGQKPADATLEQAIAMAAETLKQGAEYSGARGIVLGVEDDGGITEFAKETIEIVTRADSQWAGMNLDIGNFRPPKVYEQIEMSIPHAVSTHIKTELTQDDGTKTPFDWDRVFGMFVRHGYRGYMGLEYEANEDPTTAIPKQLRRLKELAQKYSV